MKASAGGYPLWLNYVCRRLSEGLPVLTYQAKNTNETGLSYQAHVRFYNRDTFRVKKEQDAPEKPFREVGQGVIDDSPRRIVLNLAWTIEEYLPGQFRPIRSKGAV